MCESRRYALIFPALDVASAYPLNAITLGNNLMAAWASDLTPKVARFRRVRLFFRLLAAVPPIVGAFLAKPCVQPTVSCDCDSRHLPCTCAVGRCRRFSDLQLGHNSEFCGAVRVLCCIFRSRCVVRGLLAWLLDHVSVVWTQLGLTLC